MLAVSSCESSKDQRPKDLIPESKMVAVMVDMHLFEAQVESKKMRVDSLAVLIKSNYRYIYKQHGITEEEFKKTFHYYERHPGEMDELYGKVIDSLSQIQADLSGDIEQKPE